MTRWLVDGMNVIGQRPDGWWRDRRGAMRSFAGRLASFAVATGEPVAVVYDGRPFDLDATPIEIGFASGGRNAADDEIARRVADDDEPGTLTVVTSDRELARRVGDRGAEVVSSGAFRRRLDAL